MWQRERQVPRTIPNSCSPRAPDSYPRRSRRPPKLSNSCLDHVQQLPNVVHKLPRCRGSAQQRPVLVESCQFFGRLLAEFPSQRLPGLVRFRPSLDQRWPSWSKLWLNLVELRLNLGKVGLHWSIFSQSWPTFSPVLAAQLGPSLAYSDQFW